MSINVPFLAFVSFLLFAHDATSASAVSTTTSASDGSSLVHVWRQEGHNETSICELLYDIPKECVCTEPSPLSAVIACNKTFRHEFLNDTIGMAVNLLPCDPDGAKLTVDITELKHGIDYTVAGVKAGETKNYPIPGLSIIVPTVGHLGVDVSVYIGGNIDSLRVKVGLNACAVLGDDHSVCASSVPGLNQILPFWVLKGTYSFGNACNATTVAAAAVSSLSTATK
jgi:hypothetical protein